MTAIFLFYRIAELADDEDQLKSEIDEALEVLEKVNQPCEAPNVWIISLQFLIPI